MRGDVKFRVRRLPVILVLFVTAAVVTFVATTWASTASDVSNENRTASATSAMPSELATAIQNGVVGRQGSDARRPSQLGSVAFEPGVSHAEAMRAIYVAQETGRAEAAMSMGGPLSAGVSAIVPANPGEGVIVGLASPFGYDPSTGIPLAGVFTIDSEAVIGRQSDAGPWPVGARLAIPVFPSCMVRSEVGVSGGCRNGEVPVIDFTVQPPLALP